MKSNLVEVIRKQHEKKSEYQATNFLFHRCERNLKFWEGFRKNMQQEFVNV